MISNITQTHSPSYRTYLSQSDKQDSNTTISHHRDLTPLNHKTNIYKKALPLLQNLNTVNLCLFFLYIDQLLFLVNVRFNFTLNS